MRRSVGRLGIGEARGPLHWAPDREASLVKKEYCRCGPLPPQVTSPRARPPHARERATLSPPGIPGPAALAHGPHCTAGIPPTCTGGCSRCPIAFRGPHTSVGGNAQRSWANLACRSRAMGTIAADSSRAARATTHPGPHLSHMVG